MGLPVVALVSVLVAAGVGLVVPAVPTSVAAPADPWHRLVSRGRQLWQESPDPGMPVACATCHHDPESVRGWATAFPRFRPLPPPHGRVMTLLQANAEAVARHYPDTDVRATAVAITAYLTARAEGRPVSPGVAPGEPAFPDRLAVLATSVTRGAVAFTTRCAGCHKAEVVAPALVGWSRLVRAGAGPPEVFLEQHPPGAAPLPWDGRDVADLLAYLTSRQAGRALDLGPFRTAGR